MKEKEILTELNKCIDRQAAKHIVQIVDGFIENKEMFLISELMDGNLKHNLINISDLEGILLDLSTGLKSLHLNGFVHFDIRPGNAD